jgi:membrane protease YdiL (CAAX protease family)
MILYIPSVTLMSVVYKWVFNNTKGSLLVAILLHTSFDVLVGPVGLLFPAPVVTSYGGAVPLLIGLSVTALVLVVFTRGRLSYEHYLQEEAEQPNLATAST